MRVIGLCLFAVYAIAGCDDSSDAIDAIDGALVDAGAVDATVDTAPDLPDAMADAAGPAIEPASGSMAGYYPVVLDPAPLSADAVAGVSIGEVPLYGLEVTADGRLRGTVQGAPTAGAALIEVTDADGAVTTLGATFEYTAPVDDRLLRMAGIGASLGQGIQRGVPSVHGVLMAPPAQLARHVGAYMPLPVPIEGLFVPIGLGDLGPAPICESPGVGDFLLAQSRDIVGRLTGGGGGLDVRRARVTPAVAVGNVSTGNSEVVDVLEGPTNDNLAAVMISHLVYEPARNLFAAVERTQLDAIEDFGPTVVVSFDLYGNDIVAGISDERVKPDKVTPPEVLHPAIEAVVERLATLDAVVFIGDLPRPSVLSRATSLRALADEMGTRDEAEAGLVAIDEACRAANAVLRAAADRHPRVFVVPVAEAVDQIAREGIVLDGEVVDVARFGGLIGLDGLHFTDTGYALLADLFVSEMNRALGLALPPVDIEAVFQADPERPSRLAAEGFDREMCYR